MGNYKCSGDPTQTIETAVLTPTMKVKHSDSTLYTTAKDKRTSSYAVSEENDSKIWKKEHFSFDRQKFLLSAFGTQSRLWLDCCWALGVDFQFAVCQWTRVRPERKSCNRRQIPNGLFSIIKKADLIFWIRTYIRKFSIGGQLGMATRCQNVAVNSVMVMANKNRSHVK